MMVKRVVFIRCAETDWNRQGRWQGWVAAPLNEHGRRQAQALAHFVRHIGMSALYTSDLKRAMETAQIIAEQLGFEPIPDPRLRERNIGQAQGLTLEEIRVWYPDEYAAFVNDPEDFHLAGAESRREVRARMRDAFDDIIAANAGETVGILSHSTAIRALLESLIPHLETSSIDLKNTSVTTIRREEGDRWSLVTADDVMHLEGLETYTFPELEQRR